MRLASLIISISKINGNMVEVGQKGPRKWVEVFTFDVMRKERNTKKGTLSPEEWAEAFIE